MKFDGKIIFACEPKSGVSKTSGREWTAQDFVLETMSEQPQSIVFNVFGADKIEELNINVGDNVTVDINFTAKEYNGRYFNSLSLVELKKHKESKKKVKITDADPTEELPF